MVTPYEVPADRLIKRLAEYLKKESKIVPPLWSRYAKTGPHRLRPPHDRDWWYYRCASLLRKIYMHGPLSVKRLEAEYGGSRKRGVKPRHHIDAGSSAIRVPLKQLEECGYVRKTPKGRLLTPKGKGLLEQMSQAIFDELVKENPALKKYA
ncbi:MAG: 30S ribosomal protein S19e [Thaumarchaeota archaeon]|nr:30S ribosomal protein S19e [Nitrososphaerota archaeon]